MNLIDTYYDSNCNPILAAKAFVHQLSLADFRAICSKYECDNRKEGILSEHIFHLIMRLRRSGVLP